MENAKKSERGLLRKMPGKFLAILKKQSFEFCRETGLHGYKYIGEPHRSIPERIAWAVTAFTSLFVVFAIMKYSSNYYAEHRTSSVIKSTHHGIWNYPFPAVTVCDLNRVSLKLTRELVEKLKLPPTMSKEFIVEEMSLLNELLYPGKHEGNLRNNQSRLQNIFDTNNLSISTVINSVTRDCESFLAACKWQAEERKCSTMFRSSFTRDGICCSFNYITHEQIIENPKVLPYKMTSCGYQSGLNILVNLEPDDYHSSIIGSVGIKVMLHDPYDYPDYDASSRLIAVDKYSFLTVQPLETYATENVKLLPLSSRSCIFPNEKDMIGNNSGNAYFIPAKYSFRNCMLDCRASIIKAKCGCIPYYYPQNRTKVCDLRDIECLDKFKYWYATSWPGTDMSPKTLSLVQVDVTHRPCGCKPDCNFYRYSMENSIGNLDSHIYYNGLQYTNLPSRGKPWRNQSIVHVFFGDLVSIQFRRDVHYNWRHIFATFGGLLGLFAGFSLMSVFEFIYFYLIRPVTDACARWRNAGNGKQTNYQ
ncbi:sodium channel protein Nach [Andrena cerasifolii]|uniref:sodium channel protein Nach n=1 Tax=Andrena cerasifolii TaxID=2819439 RepID=UPI004037F421